MHLANFPPFCFICSTSSTKAFNPFRTKCRPVYAVALHYTTSVRLIHVWHMVAENCIWQKILKCCVWLLILKHCVWRVISKHCVWRQTDARQALARCQPDATFLNQASGAHRTPARCPPDTSQTQSFEIRRLTQNCKTLLSVTMCQMCSTSLGMYGSQFVDLKRISRGPEALQSHLNDFYHCQVTIC